MSLWGMLPASCYTDLARSLVLHGLSVDAGRDPMEKVPGAGSKPTMHRGRRALGEGGHCNALGLRRDRMPRRAHIIGPNYRCTLDRYTRSTIGVPDVQ
jgi:hypothetical protein